MVVTGCDLILNSTVHVLFHCQDLFVCSLRKKYMFLFSASPFLWRHHIFCMSCCQSVSDFLSQQHNKLCHFISNIVIVTNRLAQQNLQIPDNANNRTLPSWLFGACLSARDRLTSSRPDAILVHPLPTKKSKSPTTPHLHQVSQPRLPSRDVHTVHVLNINTREIHLVN